MRAKQRTPPTPLIDDFFKGVDAFMDRTSDTMDRVFGPMTKEQPHTVRIQFNRKMLERLILGETVTCKIPGTQIEVTFK